MSNGKAVIIFLIVGFIKNTLWKMSSHFTKPYKRFGGNVKVELDLSNYTKKAGLKNEKGVYATKLDAESEISLKAEIDKMDAEK